MDNTERMYKEIDDDMEGSGFFPSLRARAGLVLDTEETHQLCDYLYWMEMNKREVKIELTDEDKRRCGLSKQRKMYWKYDADEETSELMTY